MKMDAPELHYRCDKNVVIYTRPNSKTPHYYARIKLPLIGKWKKFTTKTDDLEKAIAIAVKEYEVAKIKLANGIVLDTRRFSHVADLAIGEMQEELELGIGRVSYNEYIPLIGKYKKFFGNKYMSNINYDDLVRYDAHRTKQLGRKASASTINTHNAALAKVFDLAVNKGWIHQSQVPRFKNEGRKSERRPHFDCEEVKVLRDFMNQYVRLSTEDFKTGGVTQRSIAIRLLLRDFVEFVLFTGARPGTETSHLKWKHISVRRHRDGKKYIEITIPKGKTRSRKVIAMTNIQMCLERLLTRFCDTYFEDLTLEDDLSSVDEYIFRLPDGTEPKDLHGAFEKLLEEAGLRKSSDGKNRSLYSLRHTYATLQLELGIPVHTIAINMGTSVKMIEKHYSHLEVWKQAAELAGRGFQGEEELIAKLSGNTSQLSD